MSELPRVSDFESTYIEPDPPKPPKQPKLPPPVPLWKKIKRRLPKSLNYEFRATNVESLVIYESTFYRLHIEKGTSRYPEGSISARTTLTRYNCTVETLSPEHFEIKKKKRLWSIKPDVWDGMKLTYSDKGSWEFNSSYRSNILKQVMNTKGVIFSNEFMDLTFGPLEQQLLDIVQEAQRSEK